MGGVPERSEASIDGMMGDGWVMDGWAGSQSRKKSCIFNISQKLFDIFFLVVSFPLRRVFKTFSERNSKKIKNFKFFKIFRTTFFFQRFFRFFFKKSKFLKIYSIFFPSCFASPLEEFLRHFLRKTQKK